MKENNMFDTLFQESLVNLESADIEWTDKKGPFVKGEELDWNDDELVDELMNYEFVAPQPKEV